MVMLKIAEAYVDKQISFHAISSLHLYVCGRALAVIYLLGMHLPVSLLASFPGAQGDN